MVYAIAYFNSFSSLIVGLKSDEEKSKETVESEETKETVESEETKETVESEETKETVESEETKETESEETKETVESEETKETVESEEACENEFSIMLNTKVDGAKGYSDIKTLKDCSKRCLDMQKCTAFDFDRNNQPYKLTRCWIHQSSNLDTKDKQAVDHYKKNTCSLEPGQYHTCHQQSFYIFHI